MNLISYFKNKRQVHVYNKVKNINEVIFCPICLEDTYNNKTCTKCNFKWCVKCHNKLLQSRLIFKDDSYNMKRFFYYCPISRRKIYLDDEEKKIMNGNKIMNGIMSIKERFSKSLKK